MNQVDEFRTGPRVQAAPIPNGDGPGADAQAAASPRISDATEMYFRPASRAAATAARTPITFRAPSSRMSIGRLTPAITSMSVVFIRLMARLDGVPPNRSVR